MSTSTRRREERLEVRLTTAAKRLLQRAAAVREQSISAFILDSGMTAAAETLADRREFRIPAKAKTEFHDVIAYSIFPRPAFPSWSH